MTTICAMQPYLFPYLPYFQLAHAVDAFWVLDDVQYIRRGWMNRNRILLGGAPHTITFPVAHGARNETVAEKRLAADFEQALFRLKTTLRHAYAAAPRGAAALALVPEAPPGGRFLDFAMESLGRCFAALGLATPLRFASDLALPGPLRGQDRILELCAAAGATAYVNPAGGRALYDPAAFAARGVALRFLDGQPDPYPQTGTDAFVPELSVLDLLAHLDGPGCAARLCAYRLSES